MLSSLMTCLFFIASLWTWKANGHVRLTFPPARQFALDFLDDRRTAPPCGTPQYPGAPRTTFIEGTAVRATWHLSYAHTGGAKLEIIRENPRTILASLTGESFTFLNDSTRQYADVILPIGLTCDDCTFRLLREAAEWGGGYKFWSCADIIISPHPDAGNAQCAPTVSQNNLSKPTKTPYGELEVNGKPEPSSEPETHGEPEPTSEPETHGEPEPTSEPETHGEPEPTSEPEVTPEPEQNGELPDLSTNSQTVQSSCQPESALPFNACYDGKCLNGGSCNATTGTCSCLKLFSGDRCQEFDLCWSDSDCNDGKCIDTRSTTHPRLICYCEEGWYGNNCNLRSNIVIQDDYQTNTDYESREISPIMSIHWKIDNQEIEIALQAKTLSWVGLGWRPRSLTDNCKAFPSLAMALEVDDKHTDFVNSQRGLDASVPAPSVDPEKAIEDALESNIERRCNGGKTDKTPTGQPEPNSNGEPEPTAEPETHGEPEPSSEPETHGEPEPTAEPETHGEPEPTSEPETHGEPEPTAEPETHGEPEPTSEPETHGEPEPTSEPETHGEPEPTSEPETHGEPEPTAEPETHGEPEPTAEPETHGEPEPTAEPETHGEPEPTAEPATHGEPEPTSEPNSQGSSRPPIRVGNPLTHPMDCTDMVIGSVKGNLHRVQDMYTKDRSTPRPDKFYNGRDDLVGSAGAQVDGITTIVFRKKLQATQQSDHTIDDQAMSVIWAVGQGVDRYIHAPASGLEACTSSDTRFYRHDELKYHGIGNNQRGSASINFFDTTPQTSAESCTSEGSSYKEPRNCDTTDAGFNCNYYVSWTLNTEDDKISFVLKSKQSQSKWMGLGISANRRMADTDAVLAWIDGSNQAVVKDRFLRGYSLPNDDASNDLENVNGGYENGVMTFRFSRPRATADRTEDVSFTDTDCRYLLYATGPLNNAGTNIQQHSSTPSISLTKICIRACSAGKVIATFTSQLSLDEEYTPELEDPTSLKFRELKLTMETLLTNIYKQDDDRSVNVIVVGFSAGSIIVDYNVSYVYDPTVEDSDSVQVALQAGLVKELNENGGNLGDYTARVLGVKMNEPFAEWKIAVICACIMGAVLVIIAVVSLCYQSHKRRNNFQAMPMTEAAGSSRGSDPKINNYDQVSNNSNSLEKEDLGKKKSPV